MPKLFEIEHILYLTISSLILIPLGIILKLKVKKEEHIVLMFRIIGLIGLIIIILNRIFIGSMLRGNMVYLIPDSFCGMTSFLVAIGLLFFKRDNALLHMTWLLALVGDTLSLIIPDYLADGPVILYLPTITSLIHHSYTLFSVIMIFLFNYITLSIKKAWTQALMGAIYLGTGLILVHGIRIPDAFFINNPAIKGSPLIVWVMLPIYLVVYFIIILIVELIRKKRNAQLNDLS